MSLCVRDLNTVKELVFLLHIVTPFCYVSRLGDFMRQPLMTFYPFFQRTVQSTQTRQQVDIHGRQEVSFYNCDETGDKVVAELGLQNVYN